jgi:hypothetical protein
MTYAELVQKIRDYTEVDSSVLTSTIVDGFIRDAEFRIFREVDADYARVYATSNFTSGNRYILLPTDTHIVRSVQVINGSTRTFLDKRDTSFISEYNNDNTTGEPKYYANWDDDNIVVAPTPDSGYEIQLNYIPSPPALSSSNTQTDLSKQAPDVLLYACLVEAYGYLKGPADMYNLYQNRYNEAIQSYALEQMGRRRRDEYTDGVPRVKIPSPSPNN